MTTHPNPASTDRIDLPIEAERMLAEVFSAHRKMCRAGWFMDGSDEKTKAWLDAEDAWDVQKARLRAALSASAPAASVTDEMVDDDDNMTLEEWWQNHLDRNDRNSPEEYPEMILVSFEEMAQAMAVCSAPAAHRPAAPVGEDLSRWQHKDTGRTYVEIKRGRLAHDIHLNSGNIVVVYRSEEDGKLWLRYAFEFEDGRFERLVDEDRSRVATPPRWAGVDREALVALFSEAEVYGWAPPYIAHRVLALFSSDSHQTDEAGR